MPKEKLQPYLTPLSVFALAFGCAVGWGSFIMPGTVFLPLAGPVGITIGMAIGGILMLIIGYNYHYMMNRQKDAGGTYAFNKRVFGFDHGFLSGWFLLLVFLAITWANITALVLIFRNLMGELLNFGFHYTIAGYDIYMGEVLVEIGAILLFGAIAMYKKNLAARLQTVFVFIMLLGITVGFISAIDEKGIELFLSSPSFSPKNSEIFGTIGIIALAPWAFAGFESISNSTEEFKFNPKRTFFIMAIAVFLGIYSYVALSFLAVSANPYAFSSWFVYVNAVPGLTGLNHMPVFHAVYKLLGDNGLILLGITLFAAVMTGVIGNTIAGSRLLYAMARDKLLPSWFKKLTEEGAPKNTILFIMLLSLPIPFIGRAAIGWIIDVNTIGATIAYAYTSAAALKVALSEHNKKVTVTGAIGLIVSSLFFLYFMVPWDFSLATLASESYLILIAWSMLGFLFFRYIFVRDKTRLVGKSTVAWITLLTIIIFSSMLWMRESLKVSLKDSLKSIYTYHLNELKSRNIRLDSVDHQKLKDFFSSELARTENSLTFHNLFQLIVISITIFIMFRLYTVMMLRERQSEFERKLIEKESVAKSTFFFNMSHDIRTPMNAIVGYVNLMKKEEYNEKSLDYLNKIEMASNNLLSLINDILELSRIENGKYNLEIENTNIKNRIVEVEDLFRTQMNEKNLEYKVDIDIQNEWIAADGKKLNRVLLNLISNSYKFTKTGGVYVSVTEINKEDYLKHSNNEGKSVTENNMTIAKDVKISEDRAYYEIRVKDTGIGMSEEFAATIFDAYTREIEAAEVQGTGLGMSITKTIIDMMGGSVFVKSQKGLGTTFTIYLSFPILRDARERGEAANGEAANGEAANGEAASAESFKGLRVLLAEDIEMNREIATMILSEFGIVIDHAENGEIALRKVIESENNPYDLVLMDIQMPKMNGYECARAIRGLDNPKLSTIPIIAMTANAFEEDVENAKKAGMNAHISKPLDVPKMMETIKEVLG